MTEHWTEVELRAAVRAYIDMRAQNSIGNKVNKTDVYRQLATQHNRTEKAFEYRMQNISHVYALLGRAWVSGLLPAKNVGAATAKQIESLIYEEEGIQRPPIAAFAEKVSSLLQKPISKPPSGNKKPEKTISQTTTYNRDPKIVAYVLQVANNHCECCGNEAPFMKPDGSLYLEVHHLRRLADGGSDTTTNATALCPNCHRELHYGAEQEQHLKRLYKNVSRLIPE